jgi:uncharacterized protein
MIEFLIYWFMFPACIAIVSLAMMLGIDGTAILTPAVILAFPLLGIPSLTPAQAVSAGLFTEFFGFLSGVVAYERERLIDFRVGLRLTLFAVPTIVVFSLLSQFSPALLLKLVFGVLLVGLSIYLLGTAQSTVRNPLLGALPPSIKAFPRRDESRQETVIRTRGGKEYRYRVCSRKRGELTSVIGSAFEGLISVGLGELLMPDLIRRCKIPISVSAATSVFVMTLTVLAGSLTGMLALAIKGGAASVPWNFLVFTVPGAILGGQIGSRAQGRLSSSGTERLIIVIFAVIGISFLYVSGRGFLG